MRSFEEIKASADEAMSNNSAEVLLSYVSELDNISTPDAEALACAARGRVLVLRGDYPTAMENYERALALYEELGDRSGVALVTGSIGIVHRFTGNFPAALECYHHALVLHEELGDRNGVARVTGNIGIVYHNTGDYPAALDYYHRAIALHEELGHRSGVATATGNIGTVYHSTGDYSAALKYYHNALVLHQELDNRSGVALVTENIGLVHDNIGDHATALEHYHRALAMFEALSNHSGMAGTTAAILSTLIATNALFEARQTLRTLDTMQIGVPGTAIIREMGRAHLQELELDVAASISTLKNALSIAVQHEMRSPQSKIHKSLRDLALKQNDLAKYVEHNNEYTRLTEEINGKDTATKLAMQAKQREIDAVQREHQKHMAVLHSALPREVAERVARGEVVNDHFENATVIFLDIVGFTELSSTMSSQEVITLLDDVFTQCDAICAKHGVTKIKTIGDSYMCVSFDNVVNAARVALEMVNIKSRIKNQESYQGMLQFRIGIHCGPVTAGVIGKERMQYDVWGDTVNVASRMESAGEPGKVHVSEAFASNLKSNQESRVKNPISESHEVSHEVSHAVSHEVSHAVPLVTRHSSLVTLLRGSIDIKGKGVMRTYWLDSSL
jgi:adenylate cyclase